MTAAAAKAFGGLVANYSRVIVAKGPQIIAEFGLPREPALWIGWHEANLLTLALHAHVTGRGAVAFIPPGLSGAAMRGWLDGLGIIPVPLAADARRGLALRQMEAALGAGKDVLIAVDGPRGPRHRIAPGALWLARARSVQIRPVGAYAWPALRLPRWDRLLVPLPGARVTIVIGPGTSPPAPSAHTRPNLHGIAAMLDRLTERAQIEVRGAGSYRQSEVARWL